MMAACKSVRLMTGKSKIPNLRFFHCCLRQLSLRGEDLHLGFQSIGFKVEEASEMVKEATPADLRPTGVSARQVERSGIAYTLHTFSTSASMHGLSKITDVRYTPLRVIWVLATLTCTGFLIWQIYSQIALFNQHRKKTLLTVSYAGITFPDVTICNYRHVDVDILYSLFYQYHLDNGSVNPKELYQMKNLSRARPVLENEFMKKQSEYVETVRYYLNNYTRLFNRAFSRTIFWSVLNLTYSGLNAIVAPVNELTTVCHWGDEKCPSENREIRDNYFRKCLTLRPPENRSIQQGIENGLSVISLVGSGMLPLWDIIKNYTTNIPGLSEHANPLAGTDGLHVVVHQRDSPPLPMSEGFTIPPGYMGSLGIKVDRYRRMEAPHGNCIKSDPYNSDPKDRYRLAVCLQRCIQNNTINICNCSSPSLPLHFKYWDPNLSCSNFQPVPDNCQNDEPPLSCLSPFEELERNILCSKMVKEQIMARPDVMMYCGCYPACNEDAYNIGFSLGAWPSLMETDHIWYSELGPRIKHFIATQNYSDIKKQLFTNHFTEPNRYKAMRDFVKLNVYLSDAAVQETTEEEDYLLINLVADIGGAMGLWVGMSILSLMEFVQLLLDILVTFYSRKVM